MYFEWVARRDEVFEYDVYDVLVEYLHVAERVYVELQTLEFDAALSGDVFEPERGEVREVRERADARELGQLELDSYLAPDVLVGKSVERVETHLLARRGAYV